MHHTQTQTQEQQFLPPLPPPNLQAHLDDPGFSALLAETRTILSSSDFSRVLEVCLDTATEVLFAGLEKNVFVPNEPALGDDVLRIRLAGLLPGLARWSQLALNGLPNELVDVSFFFLMSFGWFDANFTFLEIENHGCPRSVLPLCYRIRQIRRTVFVEIFSWLCMVTCYRMHILFHKLPSQAVPYQCYRHLRVRSIIHALFAMSLHRVELRTSSSSYVPAGGVETVAGGPHCTPSRDYTHMR
jgi:hypothetical protein